MSSFIFTAGQTIWLADAHRDNGKRFVARSDEKLTAFYGAGISGSRLRRIESTSWWDFPKIPGYETKHSTSSNHICARLLSARPKHASGKSAARRRLSRRQHSRGKQRPLEPYHRHVQHGSRYIFGPKPHRRQLLHRRWRWNASCEH